MTKLISVIVPVYNEESNIPLVFDALNKEFSKLVNYDFELIFVDDGSTDGSMDAIERVIAKDSRVKFIEFSRNFGKEVATTAGLNEANGDAALMLDADLQHPVELIPEFITKWENGADMVVGVRKQNQNEGIIKKFGSWVFYRIINFIGQTKITRRATDYRLLDRRVISEFKRFTEHNRITRGLLDWLGFKTDYVHFVANERKNGKASYTPNKLFKLAITSFVSHSLFPLKFAGYLGALIIITSGPLGVYIYLDRYIFHDPFGFSFSGTAILAVLNVFLIGIVLSCLGLIAMYIGSIQNEVINRPIYVIRRKK